VRVLHVSDFHFGSGRTHEALDAFREITAALNPALVVATGDLAHRGRRSQLEAAADLLRGLGRPLVAVPGNHDIPYSHARFTRPFAEWHGVLGETEPIYRSEQILVVGLNSVRPLRHEGGGLRDEQLDRVEEVFRTAGQSAVRMVALHHHLAAPPWRTHRKRPVKRRDAVLRRLAAAGAEVVVSGHVHQASFAERREFEALQHSDLQTLVLATSAGFGRPRPHRKGEALGFNLYDADSESLAITTYVWHGKNFGEVGRRLFPRQNH
jgi:3',5'-cyclic AMP phosphodiesterase CpdA